MYLFVYLSIYFVLFIHLFQPLPNTPPKRSARYCECSTTWTANTSSPTHKTCPPHSAAWPSTNPSPHHQLSRTFLQWWKKCSGQRTSLGRQIQTAPPRMRLIISPSGWCRFSCSGGVFARFVFWLFVCLFVFCFVLIMIMFVHVCVCVFDNL